jgi:hypothetical protein
MGSKSVGYRFDCAAGEDSRRIALVNKLWAILLFEADSNMFNSYVFGQRAMEMARLHNLIPQEQYAERQSVGQHSA